MDTMNSSFTTVPAASMMPGHGTSSNSSASTTGINNSAMDECSNLSAASLRQSSREFSEQIRRLELEGNKLREVTLASLSGNLSMDATDTSFETVKSVVPPASLASLVDISSEQKTISDLRVQLEQQRKETDRLQSQLLTDLPPSHSFTSVPSSPSKSAFSTLPQTPELSTSRNRAFEFVPPSHLERALKESQEQVSDLRKRLQEGSDMTESQKRQFRVNIEELKSKLHETIVNRDTILELRQKEAASQEGVIAKLKSSLQQQHERNKQQEASLSDAKKKLEAVTHTSNIADTAITQIQTLLAEREKCRGKPFFESNFVSSQGPAMLIHTLERCLQDLDTELDTKRSKVIELQQDLDRAQSVSSQKVQTLAKDYHENLQRESEDALKRVAQMTSEHELQLEAANERATNARKQAASLQNQLQVLQSQYDQQMKLKDDLITDLETKVQRLKEDQSDDRSKWQERRDALEHSLDKVQRDLSVMRADREETGRKCGAMETHIHDFQGCVSRLEAELEMERVRIKKQLEREEELRSKLLLTENSLTGRQQDVDRLEKMLDVVKQECSTQLQDRVSTAEKTERDRSNDHIRSLMAQLTSQTEKCSKVTVELEVAKSEMANFKEQVKELTEKLESARIQLEAAMSEKRHLSELVSDRKGDVERVSKEKDYYFSLLEQKNEELSQLKATKEKLLMQVDEKERNVLALKQQSDNISQLVEANSKTSENIREEKERIIYLLNEKSAAVDELRTGQDSLGKKLRLREKRVRDLEEERMRLTEDLALKVQEMDIMHQEKDNLFKELKDSRLEVANITQTKDMIKKELSKLRSSYEKEISKLQSKLKGAEHDVKLAQKTLRSKDSVDNKAVRYADKMQKEMTNKRGELDSLLSKVRKFEDKLETLAKEKLLVEKDKDSLKKSLSKSLLHTQELTVQLETSAAKNHDLRERLALMEAELEKSGLKTATAQAKMEQFEQDIARLKLNHQLDLKEAEQVMSGKTPYSGMPPTGQPSRTNSPVSRQGKESGGFTYLNKPRSSTTPVPRQGRDSVGFTHPHKQGSSVPPQEHKNPQEPRENYAVVGQELKDLLTEMRSLIAGQREVTHKSNLRPSVYHSSPVPARDRRSKDSGSSPDLDSLSDSEIEPTWLRARARARSHIDFSGVSSVREVNSAPQTPQRRHRRSCSADLSSSRNKPRQDSRYESSHMSVASSPGRSAYSGSPYRSRDGAVSSCTCPPSFPGDAMPLLTSLCTPPRSLHPSQTHPATHLVVSPVDSTPVSPSSNPDKDMDINSFDPASMSSLTPDTQVLCKRLEEKIENLTKMGGNLQRENREMANLMTMHGRKIDSVREHERKLRKSPR
ncbi:coiled-coil domain-containing protein 158-like isoform X2 [Haliotis rufescens]|uniref:coiled-coil domain-containing protein 158-like isoform X2 n=1 Tax=Haliotis rufescens TaxID=6454 RepID=UPI00201F5ABC|nr:coiled-coil domain-containing protein 158-like isoform X2 [Haliotis rufescens]